MQLPEYISKAEVQRVCRELGIRDWTTLTTAEVTLDEAQVIQAEVGAEASKLSPSSFVRAAGRVGARDCLSRRQLSPTTTRSLTGKIVLAHLKEMLDYYVRLEVVELEGDMLKAVVAGNADKAARLYRG